jgi:hypothetical protein
MIFKYQNTTGKFHGVFAASEMRRCGTFVRSAVDATYLSELCVVIIALAGGIGLHCSSSIGSCVPHCDIPTYVCSASAFMTGEKIELRAHEVDINPQYADSMEIETFTMHLSFESVTEADEGGLGTSSGRGEK